MFSAPFALLAVCYSGLPTEIGILRVWIGHNALSAPKSLFMVFRLPLMNLIHGLMAAVMLSCAAGFENPERRGSYQNMFLTLQFSVAIKSIFEAVELSLPVAAVLRPYAGWIGVGSLSSVAIGIGSALIRGRRVPLPWPELRLTIRDKLTLSGLFAAYLTIVIVSLLGSHRA